MFDLNQFVADCRAARAVDKSHQSVREVVRARSQTLQTFSTGWANQNGRRSRRFTILAI